MAYTTLPTQSAGQVASASGWANLVKADMDSMGPHLIARRTSDQIAGGADTQLILPMLANDVWLVNLTLGIITANAAVSWIFPSGNIFITAAGNNTGGTATFSHWSDVSSPSGAFSFAPNQNLHIYGLVRNGATPGDFKPSYSTGTIITNSTLYAVKLA